MKVKLASAFMVLSLMLSMGITALAVNETDVDQFGTPAPKLAGVKWLLAPTITADSVEFNPYHGYSTYSTYGAMGILDRFGKTILPAKYAMAQVREGYLDASLKSTTHENTTALFEISGKQVTDHIYGYSIEDYYYADKSGRYVMVNINDSEGEQYRTTYVNLDTGKELPRMKDYGPFKDGLVGIRAVDGRRGYCDTSGNITYAPKEYTYIHSIGPNRFLYYKQDNGVKYMGICDLNFKSLIETEEANGHFDYETYLLKIGRGTNSAVYNWDGKLLLEPGKDYGDIYVDDTGKRYIELFEQTPGWKAKYHYYFDSNKVVYADDLPEGYYREGVLTYTAAPLATEGTMGVKDSKGNWVVPKSYIDVKGIPGSGGYAVLCQNPNYAYDIYDLRTAKKLSGGYIRYQKREDFLRVEIPNANSKKRELLSLVDRTGKQLIKAYDEVGVANVIVAHNWGDYKNIVCDVYDLNGNLLRSESKYNPFISLSLHKDGLGIIETCPTDGLFGYCDLKFNEVIPCVFDYCLDFGEGQAWVKYQGKWGMIDNPLNSTAETYWESRTKPSKDLTAVKTTASVVVDGRQLAFDAYNIDGNNYFKLRDIAKVVSGTQKQFDVSWDDANKAINLLSGTAYTVVGGELATGAGVSMKATANTSPILKDKLAVKLTAYNISGNNYFKLRDLGQAFNFAVTWDGATNSIHIDTSKGYTG